MTRAKLINKKTGLEIEGEIVYRDTWRINFQIEGTADFNTFTADDWHVEVIKPHVENLPNGLYQVTILSNYDNIEHAVTYRKTDEGIKNALNNQPLLPEDLEILQDYYEKGRLVRLVRERVIFEEAS